MLLCCFRMQCRIDKGFIKNSSHFMMEWTSCWKGIDLNHPINDFCLVHHIHMWMLNFCHSVFSWGTFHFDGGQFEIMNDATIWHADWLKQIVYSFVWCAPWQTPISDSFASNEWFGANFQFSRGYTHICHFTIFQSVLVRFICCTHTS